MYQLQRENERLSREFKLIAATLETHLSQRPEPLKRNVHLNNIVRTRNSPMNAVCDLVLQVAPYAIPVLVTGESGTGKELITRAIHYNSPRAGQAFIMENCGSLPVQLLETELFGYTKGGFYRGLLRSDGDPGTGRWRHRFAR